MHQLKYWLFHFWATAVGNISVYRTITHKFCAANVSSARPGPRAARPVNRSARQQSWPEPGRVLHLQEHDRPTEARVLCTDPRYEVRMSFARGLLIHGLNFSRAWWKMQFISDDKDWRRVSTQKVVTLNTWSDVIFKLLCDANGSLTEPPIPENTTGSLQSRQHLGETTYLWRGEYLIRFAFHKVARRHFECGL